MRHFVVPLLFLFVFLTAASAQTPRQKPPAILLYGAPRSTELVEFKDPRGVFKMVFPGKPIANTVEAGQADIYDYSVTRNGANSSVKIFEFKNLPTINDEEFAVSMRSFVGSGTKREILSERVVETGQRKIWEFEAAGDLRFTRVRAFRDGYRVFFLESDVTNWPTLESSYPALVTDFEKETARFFDSFVLLEPYVPDKPLTVAVYGNVEPTRYVNKFLGFAIDLPENWYVLQAEEVEVFRADGMTVFDSKNAGLNRLLKEQAKKELILLTVSSGTAESPQGSNLVATAVRIGRNEKDVVAFAGPTRQLIVTNRNFTKVSLARAVEFAGRSFAVITFEGRLGNVETKHRMYFTLKDGFVIIFVLTALNESNEAVLTRTFGSLRFDQK